MEEMMDDTLESLDEDQEELDQEADAEVDKVLYDLTGLGTLTGKQVGTGLPVRFLTSSLSSEGLPVDKLGFILFFF